MALIIPTHTGNETPSTFEADLKADMVTLEGGLAAVLGGATAQLLPAASKVPLADGTGRIDPNWMQPVVAVANWGNYLENGWFIATAIPNAPPVISGASPTAIVHVIKQSATRSVQIAYDLNGVSIFQRNYISPTWSPWMPVGTLGRNITAHNSVVKAVGTATWTLVPLDTITVVDNSTDLLISGSRIITPAWATFARIVGSVKFDTTASEIGVRVTNNGVVAGKPSTSRGAAANASVTKQISTEFVVTSGDLLGIEALQVSGATINATAAACSLSVEFR